MLRATALGCTFTDRGLLEFIMSTCTIDPETVVEVDYFLAGPKGHEVDVVVGVTKHPTLGWVVVTAEKPKTPDWVVECECESADEAFKEAEELYLCYDERRPFPDEGDW